nr:hypothetical protein [uncultured Pedobacter sp.]
MKNIIIYFFFLLNITALKAQTFSEWFRQKKTQEKYLIQQIAGLEVYTGYLKKGYEIFDKGSKTISKIKNRDFNMHQSFFNAKNKLNPNLSKLVANLKIEALNNAVTEKCIQSKKFIAVQSGLNTEQIAYFKTVVMRIEKSAKELFNEYQQLIEPDKITMNDEERLKRLMDLKRSYFSLYQFINSFCDEIKLYSQQIKHEEKDISTSQKILGLKPQ